MMSRINRYILKECFWAVTLVMSIFIAAIILVDVVEQLRTVGGDVDLSPVQAVQLTLMKLPMLVEQTLPFALLAGGMMAFTRLSKRSELSVIRAVGVSAWRFLSPLALLSFLVGVFAVSVLNPLGSTLQHQFQYSRAALLEQGNASFQPAMDSIWLRQEDSESRIIIHASGTGDSLIDLVNVKLLVQRRVYIDGAPTEAFQFNRRIDAASARLLNGFWQLTDVLENVPGQSPQHLDTLAIPTDIDPSRILQRFASPNTIGFWELPGFIHETRKAGLDASSYQMRWHALLALPILYLTMGLIGGVVCLRLARLGGTSRLLATGAIMAVTLYFMTKLAFSLGASGAAPAWLAAWSPTLFFLFGVCGLIAYREDG